MALVRSGSHGHHIIFVRPDEYVISWRVDYKYNRLRHVVTRSRDTNLQGALRFAKKWKIAMPEGRS